MRELLTPVEEAAQPILDNWLLIVLPLIALWLVSWFATAKLLELGQRWIDYEDGHRWFGPSTWFKIGPRTHFKIKGELLANRALRETYAPTRHYERDLRDKEANLRLAFLSPFPNAVKTAVKQAHLPRGKKLMAHAQIKEVARSVHVASLPKGIFVGNGYGDADGPKGETPEQRAKRLIAQDKLNAANHFRINLDANGEDPAVIAKVEAKIKTQLALHGGLDPFNTDSATQLSYIAHREPMVDLITETKVGAYFFQENPAENVYAIPLGITPDLEPWVWETHHTMIFGMTGSGKGSPIQGAIFQLAPFVKQGIAQIRIADPKNAEGRVYNEWKSSLVEQISVGMDEEDMREHAKIFADLKREIGHRSKYGKKTSIKKGAEDDGRDFEATKETPLILLIIDEFPTLFKGFEQMGKEGKKPLSDLAQVILTGRSYGVYILAATQRGDKAIMDAVIDSMQHKVCLRQTNPYFNGLFLGDDYKENGCDPARIKKATKNNGYKTAGIGYIADDEGQTNIRFAYISKIEIAELVREFRELDGLPVDEEEMADFVTESGDFYELPALDEDGDGDWESIPADAERDDKTLEDYVIDDFD